MFTHSCTVQNALAVAGSYGSGHADGTAPPEPGVSSTGPPRWAMPPRLVRMFLATLRPRRASGTSSAMNRSRTFS